MMSLLAILKTAKNYALWVLIAVISVLWALLTWQKKENKNIKLTARVRDLQSSLRQKTLAANRETARKTAEKIGDENIARVKSDIDGGRVRDFGSVRGKRPNIRGSGDTKGP